MNKFRTPGYKLIFKKVLQASSVVLCLILLVSSNLNPQKIIAALSSSDIMNESRPNLAANHEIGWTVADAGGIAEGENFVLTFAPEFNTSAIALADVDLLDDGTNLTLASNCSGGDQASFVNNGNNTFTFNICPGDGGAIAFGSMAEVKIGTNAVGGTNQIINPGAGSFYVLINGGGGYADSDRIGLSIISGVGTTAQIVTYGSLRIIGSASPGATVYFLEGGGVIGSQVANASSGFDKTLSALAPGLHLISIYATDTGGHNTLTISFNINVIAGITIIVSGIILPPTLSVAAGAVSRPASLAASGKALNNASVQIYITGSGDNISENVPTNASGDWSANVNPKLHLGFKSTVSQALDGMGGMSDFSNTGSYQVMLSADLNVDTLVNLTDFSIMMFSYAVSPPPNVISDINDDSQVNLVDFSVMMYYWTGG